MISLLFFGAGEGEKMESNPARKIKQGTCAYCGAVGDVTGDHVIPQCLWPGRVPRDVPVVDACRQCNHIWKSGNDALQIYPYGGKQGPAYASKCEDCT